MLVKLVVVDNRDFEQQFGVCCGATVHDILSESLLADDRRPKPVSRESYESLADVEAEEKERSAWEAFHFPNLNDAAIEGVERYLSRDYLAVLVLGTTGWSGWHETEGRYWTCTFDDLTDDGKAIHRQIAALYPGCDIHLLTFIDT